jgi:hypothetical protein
VGNTSGDSGGGVHSRYIRCGETRLPSTTTIKNCTISGNVALDGGGGGIYSCGHPFSGSVRLEVADSVISGNQASWNGGGVFCGSRTITTLANCTLAGNTTHASAEGGAAQFYSHLDAAISNCVLWGNAPDEMSAIDGPDPVVSYSDVQNGWPGEGNVDKDPLFVDPPNDYHLSPGSPCIDSGDPNFIAGPDERDIDGQMRVWDGDDDGVWIVDMGSDEFGSIIPGDLDRDGCVGHGDLGILLSSWGSSGGDLDGDGNTNQGDLGILLAHWGEGCP